MDVRNSSAQARLDEDTAFTGFMLGLVVGSLVALFRGPRLRLPHFFGSLSLMLSSLRRRSQEIGATTGEGLRERLEAVIPADPITHSIAEGKAAARRRRVEMGIEP